MSIEKPKQPFLKKGTRQFLSNAQNRSQSQKPRIVEFTNQQDYQNQDVPIQNPHPYKINHKQVIKEQTKISVNIRNKSIQKKVAQKKPPIARQSKSNQYQSDVLEKGNKRQKIEPEVSQDSVRKNSGSKKPTLLSDYLNNQGSTKKQTSSTKKIPQIINSNSMNKQCTSKSNNINIMTNNINKNQNLNQLQSKAHALLRQSQQDIDDDEEDYNKASSYNKNQQSDGQQQNQFINLQTNKKKVNTKLSSFKNKQQNHYTNPLLQQIAKEKQNKLNRSNKQKEYSQKTQTKKINHGQSEQENIKIDSDSDEDKNAQKNKFSLRNNGKQCKNSKNINKKYEFASDEQQVEQESKNSNQTALNNLKQNQPSKLTQKLWKKGGNQQNLKYDQKIISTNQSKNLAIEDIPEDLKQQIVQKYFQKEKKQTEELKQKMVDQMKQILNKKDQVKQQQRNFQKRVKQFQKQNEQKNKEYEAKLKSEINKINREKMYLKDHQTNKPDWKTKNQIQVLKNQLNEQKQDRKKIQTKLRGQIDRLKTKLQKQQEKNKSLTQKIKMIELNELQQKKKNKEEQAIQKKIKNIEKANYWSDAPSFSQLQRLFQKDFTLLEFCQQFYHFSTNEFYKYYQIKGQGDQLISQEAIKDRIQRKYSNGKIQIQSIQKYIKQVYPWNYSIIQFLNGDVKQTVILKKQNLKQLKLQIYYDNRQQIVEFSISPTRTIHYFIQKQQIQMNDQIMKLKQICIGNQLVRQYFNGTVQQYQKNNQGKIYRIYR